jgi:hypothetical protein
MCAKVAAEVRLMICLATRHRVHALSASLVLLACTAAFAQTNQPAELSIDWQTIIGTARTTITLQVVENPPLRPGSSIHDNAWANLAALHTDMTRLALWYPYPRLAVAELQPPTSTNTSWNFDAIDPVVSDFFSATSGHSSVFTMSALPTWMFRNANPGPIPESPDEADWSYEAGTELRDPTGKEAADYYARVAGWYTAGGFVDELGAKHRSRHRENIAWWEVLNEPEYEHGLDIQTYTRLYDRITAAVHQVTPNTRFVGMSLAEPSKAPEKFEYFLNPKHHAPGTPLDAISFHFYSDAEPGEDDKTEPYTFFARADGFLNSVRYIADIRRRLSPNTQIQINEAGCIDADDLAQGAAQTSIPPSAQYWALCGAMFAYLYQDLAAQGIELLGASQLLGYPSQFPSVSLLNWNTGEPNARYRVLQLLHDNFGPGDSIAKTNLASHQVVASAYIDPRGQRKLLLINKSQLSVDLRCDECSGAKEFHVDSTAPQSIAKSELLDTRLHLEGLSVMVVQLPH